MKQLNCRFILGAFGTPHIARQISVDGPIVDGSASLFSSLHILAMDRHFTEYVDQPVTHYFEQTHEIYTPAPQVRIQSKKKTANDISGAIGESLAAIVCRDVLRLPTAAIEPLCVYKRLKTPDFRITWDSRSIMQALAPASNQALPYTWPLEAKMRQQGSNKNALINHNLLRTGFTEVRLIRLALAMD